MTRIMALANGRVMLFCRALTEYANKNQNDLGVLLDLRDGVTARREIIGGFCKDLESSLYTLDYEGFGTQDAFGYFERVDGMLKGDGLYKPPHVIEPRDEEEPAEDGAPPMAVDGFAEAFAEG